MNEIKRCNILSLYSETGSSERLIHLLRDSVISCKPGFDIRLVDLNGLIYDLIEDATLLRELLVHHGYWDDSDICDYAAVKAKAREIINNAKEKEK